MRLKQLHINFLLSCLCLTLLFNSSFITNESEKEIEKEIELQEFYAPHVDIDLNFIPDFFDQIIVHTIKEPERITKVQNAPQKTLRQLFIIYQCLKLEYFFSYQR